MSCAGSLQAGQFGASPHFTRPIPIDVALAKRQKLPGEDQWEKYRTLRDPLTCLKEALPNKLKALYHLWHRLSDVHTKEWSEVKAFSGSLIFKLI